jgi:hypothetical protein
MSVPVLTPRKITEMDARRQKQNAKDLAELARPLVDAIRAKHDPYTTITIEFDRVIVNTTEYYMPVEVDEPCLSPSEKKDVNAEH